MPASATFPEENAPGPGPGPGAGAGAGAGRGRTVGLPIHEVALISTLERDFWRLVRPGAGRISYVMFEVEVGAGRPDALIVDVSQRALEAFRATGLRVPTPTASRALTDTNDAALGLSVPYARSLRRQLSSDGWDTPQFDRAARIVHDSLAIEAKMSDWSRALRQVAKFHITAHRSAILMPVAAASRIPSGRLENYGIGVLADTEGHSDWLLQPQRHDLAPQGRLWLLELLLRHLDAGTAYRPSDLRKLVSASANASTRGR